MIEIKPDIAFAILIVSKISKNSLCQYIKGIKTII